MAGKWLIRVIGMGRSQPEEGQERSPRSCQMTDTTPLLQRLIRWLARPEFRGFLPRHG